MNKGCGDVDPVGDAIAWAKAHNDNEKAEIINQIKSLITQMAGVEARMGSLESALSSLIERMVDLERNGKYRI